MRPDCLGILSTVDSLGRERLTTIVAIDGLGGSGKSELAARLADALGDARVVHTDDFARPNVRGWDWQRMSAQVLAPISRNEPGRYQRYDWSTDRLAEWHEVPVGGTLVVEGVSALRNELGRYWDLAIWVTAPYEVRLERGVQRDGEAMRSQWTDVWMPDEQEYLEAQRPDEKADVIVDGTRPYGSDLVYTVKRSRSASTSAGSGS
jgi:uridine kinase